MGDGSRAELLFKAKHGTVTVTIYGPRIGWEWSIVSYFRWVQSTTEPGKWEKRPPDRECDQRHLAKCVQDARKFFKDREKFLEATYGTAR